MGPSGQLSTRRVWVWLWNARVAQFHVTVRKTRSDDEFTLNCRPTVPVGCEEQVVDAKCTRPFLLV